MSKLYKIIASFLFSIAFFALATIYVIAASVTVITGGLEDVSLASMLPIGAFPFICYSLAVFMHKHIVVETKELFFVPKEIVLSSTLKCCMDSIKSSYPVVKWMPTYMMIYGAFLAVFLVPSVFSSFIDSQYMMRLNKTSMDSFLSIIIIGFNVILFTDMISRSLNSIRYLRKNE